MAITALCLSVQPVLAAAPPSADAAPPPFTQFDSGFLHGTGGKQVDVTRFEQGNTVLPGDYLVDLMVNDQFVERLRVTFQTVSGRAEAQPCIDRNLLGRAGLNLSAIPAEERRRFMVRPADACIAPTEMPANVSITFDQPRLTLAVVIPQAMMIRQARNYISPELWNKGVPSLTLRHDLDFYHSEARASDASRIVGDSMYLRLDTGLNFGTWHLRQNSAVTVNDGVWNVTDIATYVVHDMPRIRSRLTIGNSFSDGSVFDSYSFRGVSIATDDRMRPDSQTGYAPTVRGVARTNARVRIMQNGILLMETTVSPGPFQIDDLYPTGYGGDLVVTVTEADGTQQTFKVPYAALPQMLRPGVFRYALAGGEFRDGLIYTREAFVQGTLQYGVSNRLTAYTGTQLANGYYAGLAGVAFDTPIGAIAFDATMAVNEMTNGVRQTGYSLRVSLAKTLASSHTTLLFGAYRYSSDTFYSLSDTLHLRSGGVSIGRQRERFQVTVNQDLPKAMGRIYLSASSNRYWDRDGNNLQLQMGYHNVAKIFGGNVNYGLSYFRQQDQRTGYWDHRGLLSLSVALGRKPNSPQLFATVARNEAGGQAGMIGQLGVSGTLGEGQRFGYNVVANSQTDADSASLGVSYRGRGAMMTGNASIGTGYRQFSAGMSGGIVVHPGGITLANRLDDTIAVVSAPGAAGARVRSDMNIVIDGRGNAVVSTMIPYRMNQINIDPEGIPTDIEFRSTSRQVAPRSDAVVMVKFETVTGQAVLFHVTLPEGLAVPFGASVLDAKGAEIGVAGQDGQVFLRTSDSTGTLTIKWSDGADGVCRFDYALPARPGPKPPIVEMDRTCRMDMLEKGS